MSGIARTSATGGGGMLPELLAWSSSFAHDRALVREDLIGSAAHVTMLARTGLVEVEDATALRAALFALLDEAKKGTLALGDDEEDVHMAVEAELSRRLGATSGRLHTARSRNDQVALDLRLHVRGVAAAALGELAALAGEILARADRERDVTLPAYTHRQRAQPVSGAFLLAAWAEGLLRAADVVAFALDRVQISPLGSGACSGSSLPIDRLLVARLLGFPGVTANALDTVGDRDFALDWAWSGARVTLALSRIAADVIDFATREFGFVTLDGEIAAGSSMMPQKKNPDVFELIRGKASRGVGNVVALMTLVKGLPSGYNRDLQEDRLALLETGPLVRGAIGAMKVALPHVHFDRDRCAAALADGSTQATDLAEALVRTGLPFREAYKAVGQLVRRAGDAGVPLVSLDEATAKSVHPAFNAQVLAALAPAQAIAAKESIGGTGPRSIDVQLEAGRARVDALVKKSAAIPTLESIAQAIAAEPLKPSK
jgi:argininosuccinate lyase